MTIQHVNKMNQRQLGHLSLIISMLLRTALRITMFATAATFLIADDRDLVCTGLDCILRLLLTTT